jgi:multidrug efflux pump subunit AcrB
MSRFNLSAWAVRHQALVLFFIIVLALTGAWSYTKLGRNEDPSFTVKVMVVTAVWPGATADEMNRQVADPIERRLQTLPWLDYVKTYTRPGYVALQVSLKDATPPRAVPDLWYQVRKKVGDIKGELPSGVIGPSFNDEYSDVYIAVFTLTAPEAREADLVTAAERVRMGLLRVPDVEKVELLGEQAQRIFVDISNAKLAQLGLTPQAIVDALSRQNAVLPAGSYDTANERVSIRVTGALKGVDAVKAVPVAAGGRSFRLGDIAEVSAGLEDPPSFRIRKDGERALALAVAMKKGANVIALGEHLHAAEGELRRELPVGFELSQVTNQAEVVEEAISEFLFKFVVAVSIVLIVSFASLGLRTGVVVALAVPLTLAGTFTAMEALGIDLQRVSLGALILALGLLVDDAIIAIEMMVVKIEQGWERAKAATFAWESTAFPMLFGTLVTAAGFLPVGLAASSTGEYAGGIFHVVTIALIISWFVAVIFTPFLGMHLLPKSLEEKAKAFGHDEHAIYQTPAYQRLRRGVRFAMRHKRAVVAATFLLLVGAGIGLKLVPQQFFPASTRPELLAELRGPEGASFALADAEARKIEALIAGDADVAWYTTFIGAGAPRFFLAFNPTLPNPNYALVLIQTKDEVARERVHDKLLAWAAREEGAAKLRVSRLEMGPPVGYPVQFRVSGTDLADIRRVADELKQVVRADRRTRDVELDWGERAKTVELEVDQERARLLGLDTRDVALALQMLLSGYEATEVREGTRQVSVMLRAAPGERVALDRLDELVVAARDGRAIPVAQVARVVYGAEDPIIWKRNREMVLTVRADVAPGVQGPDVTADLLKRIPEAMKPLPVGVRIEPGGAYEESARANGALFAVFPLMVVAMLVLIMIQVQSFSRAVLVFATFPLGLIGAVGALLIAQQPFGFVAILGVIALGGMIMRNTLILVDQIDQDLAHGASMGEAILEATVRRARPVVLTALAAVLAFVPLASNVFWGPMATAMIGGLTMATVLTLVFLPAFAALWFKVGDPKAAEEVQTKAAA